MELKDLAGPAGAPFVLALVELVKAIVDLPSRVYPLLTLLISVVLNLWMGYVYGMDVNVSILNGILTSLVANGLYSGGKTLIKG